MPNEIQGETYAGGLTVSVVVGLDVTDPPIETGHDLARLLLQCADAPLYGSARVSLPLAHPVNNIEREG